MQSRVNILMSTYNGEKYLSEQLDSIMTQTYRTFRLTIRDDGSKDGTPAILSRYAALDDRVKLSLEDNLGVVGSFYRLLKNADQNSHFFAFADQDDVWQSNKLERGVSVLSRFDAAIPLLYCSRLEYVSADLTHRGFSPKIVKTHGIGNALVQNLATGCTIVINRAALELLLKHNWPPRVIMYDWWFYIVISAFGKVVHDDFVSMKYRQHGRNLIGGTVSIMSDFNKRITNFIGREKRGFFGCYVQACGFWMSYQEELTDDIRVIVRQFIESRQSLLHRIRYLTRRNRVYRMTLIDDILLLLLILLNRY
jgi:glycosyltransferase involved in cell wall biosynthesis